MVQQYLARFEGDEGVLFVGKAQEKANVFRTEKRQGSDGARYPWIIRSTAMVNHYYIYLVDGDFSPLFIKFCSYFPYAVKVCLNGHEWLKRQLTAGASPTNHSITAFTPAPIPNACNGSPTNSTVQRSRPFSASGSAACPIRSPRLIGTPGIAIGCPCSRPNSP